MNKILLHCCKCNAWEQYGAGTIGMCHKANIVTHFDDPCCEASAGSADRPTKSSTFNHNEKVMAAIETLNYYRNCHYNAPSGSEEYILANAINDVLPLLSNLISK
jgi:hypothetical protein